MIDANSSLLEAEAFSPLAGSPLVLLTPGETAPPGALPVLVDWRGELPDIDPGGYAALVTTRADAPAPWVGVAKDRLQAQLVAVQDTAARCPIATAVLARVLWLGEGLDFDAALELESLAYSTLLGGAEFGGWLARAGSRSSGPPAGSPVRYDRTDDHVTLTLASPGNRNAMTAAMRDALYEALVNVLEDPTMPSLTLRGEGRCFSTGGDLPEFGTARDLAAAHVIRTQRSCARILHRLGDRAGAHLYGACIGSGIEVPAAAARRTAAPDLIVQLPELRMGLIPGAGGTVSLARALGRHRFFWLALGGFRMGAGRALDWGLIHAIAP